MKVAKEGLLVTCEGEDAHGHGDADINADHAAVGSVGEFPRIVTALGEDDGAVGEGIVIH